MALPNTFQRCGLIGGLLLLCVTGYATHASLVILSEVMDRVDVDVNDNINAGTCKYQACTISSYVGLTLRIYDDSSSIAGQLVEFAVISLCFGCMIAFLIAVGDMIEDGIILQYNLSLVITREGAMVAFCLLFMLPLSLFRKVDSLKYTSTFGVLAVMFFVMVTIGKSVQSLLQYGYDSDDDIRLFPANFRDVMQACPLAMQAYNSHFIIPRIYYELYDEGDGVSRLHQMRKIFDGSVSLVTALYLSVGLFAYLEFGSRIQGDVLKNFCIQDSHDVVIIVAFILLSCKICVAFPLLVFPCRDSIHIALTRCTERLANGDHVVQNSSIGLNAHTNVTYGLVNDQLKARIHKNGNSPDEMTADNEQLFESDNGHCQNVPTASDDGAATSLPRHVTLTFLIILFALLVALAVPDIALVFSLMGSTSTAFLCYIMPAAMFLKLDADSEVSATTSSKKLFVRSFAIIGVIVALLGTFFVVEGLLTNDDTEDYCK